MSEWLGLREGCVLSVGEESDVYRLLLSVGVIVPSGGKAIGVVDEVSYVPESFLSKYNYDD